MINENHYVDIKYKENKFVILSPYISDILEVWNDKQIVKIIKDWKNVAYIFSVKI